MSIDKLSGSRPGDATDDAGKGGGNSQSASSGRYTHFQSAPPESNVNPPGKPLDSHGSATEPVAGGTRGAIEASRNRQAGMGGAAGGGNPGSSMGGAERAERIADATDDADGAETADRGVSRRDG